MDKQRFSRTMGGGTKEKPVSHWGKGAPRFRTKGFWKDALKWNKDAATFGYTCDACSRRFRDPEALGNPFACPHCGKILTLYRPRIFPSLCDWLDDEVPIEWLADFLKLIYDTPNLDWLLLTKRPENWRRRIEEAATLWFDAPECADEMAEWLEEWTDCLDMPERGAWPENIWVGTSVEDQERADERIPALLKIPAKVRFLSCEPLLGPIEFSDVTVRSDAVSQLGKKSLDGIHWVIVGGESGKGARPCDVEWIRSLIRQCRDADVACFCKQLGSHSVSSHDTADSGSPLLMQWEHKKGGDPEEWSLDLRVRQFPTL